MYAVSAASSGNWTDTGNYNASWLGDYDTKINYDITCNEDLAAFAVAVNNATEQYNFTGKNVTVTNGSLNLGAYLWEPIGNTTNPAFTGQTFNGTFDGGGNTIPGLNVTQEFGCGNLDCGHFVSVNVSPH